MNKLYALMIAGSLVIAGAISSPASAKNYNWRQVQGQNFAWSNPYNRAAAVNPYNRAVLQQSKGGPWVNAQIAANMQAAQNAQQSANYAASINPYIYGGNPYYGSYYNNNNNGYYNNPGLLTGIYGY